LVLKNVKLFHAPKIDVIRELRTVLINKQLYKKHKDHVDHCFIFFRIRLLPALLVLKCVCARKKKTIPLHTHKYTNQTKQKRVVSEDDDMYRRKENANQVTSNDRRKGGEGKNVAE
jgi:hypothetical protein